MTLFQHSIECKGIERKGVRWCQVGSWQEQQLSQLTRDDLGTMIDLLVNDLSSTDPSRFRLKELQGMSALISRTDIAEGIWDVLSNLGRTVIY